MSLEGAEDEELVQMDPGHLLARGLTELVNVVPSTNFKCVLDIINFA